MCDRRNQERWTRNTGVPLYVSYGFSLQEQVDLEY